LYIKVPILVLSRLANAKKQLLLIVGGAHHDKAARRACGADRLAIAHVLRTEASFFWPQLEKENGEPRLKPAPAGYKPRPTLRRFLSVVGPQARAACMPHARAPGSYPSTGGELGTGAYFSLPCRLDYVVLYTIA
jgi:hypothetical protein